MITDKRRRIAERAGQALSDLTVTRVRFGCFGRCSCSANCRLPPPNVVDRPDIEVPIVGRKSGRGDRAIGDDLQTGFGEELDPRQPLFGYRHALRVLVSWRSFPKPWQWPNDERLQRARPLAFQFHDLKACPALRLARNGDQIPGLQLPCISWTERKIASGHAGSVSDKLTKSARKPADERTLRYAPMFPTAPGRPVERLPGAMRCPVSVRQAQCAGDVQGATRLPA